MNRLGVSSGDGADDVSEAENLLLQSIQLACCGSLWVLPKRGQGMESTEAAAADYYIILLYYIALEWRTHHAAGRDNSHHIVTAACDRRQSDQCQVHEESVGCSACHGCLVKHGWEAMA